MPQTYAVMPSPIGPLTLITGPEGLEAILFPEEGRATVPEGLAEGPGGEAEVQLKAYFKGERRGFDVPLAPKGTDFQRQVWDALVEIPFGETCSYSDIANRLGNPAAVRAVGAANGKNPIPIIIPCHRVIGKSGKLTGYAGGLEVKRLLLDIEGHGARETLSLPFGFGH